MSNLHPTWSQRPQGHPSPFGRPLLAGLCLLLLPLRLAEAVSARHWPPPQRQPALPRQLAVPRGSTAELAWEEPAPYFGSADVSAADSLAAMQLRPQEPLDLQRPLPRLQRHGRPLPPMQPQLEMEEQMQPQLEESPQLQLEREPWPRPLEQQLPLEEPLPQRLQLPPRSRLQLQQSEEPLRLHSRLPLQELPQQLPQQLPRQPPEQPPQELPQLPSPQHQQRQVEGPRLEAQLPLQQHLHELSEQNRTGLLQTKSRAGQGTVSAGFLCLLLTIVVILGAVMFIVAQQKRRRRSTFHGELDQQEAHRYNEDAPEGGGRFNVRRLGSTPSSPALVPGHMDKAQESEKVWAGAPRGESTDCRSNDLFVAGACRRLSSSTSVQTPTFQTPSSREVLAARPRVKNASPQKSPAGSARQLSARTSPSPKRMAAGPVFRADDEEVVQFSPCSPSMRPASPGRMDY
mmetsp:Transcript_108854/g.318510  ORF Transcript_108854/g.318510 Transcript_108854/m.318510 type:complete len:459 (-) Transcript_108854:37-1413(-)